MSDDELIECDRHGTTPTCVLCKHLAFGVCCGFQRGGSDLADRWPNAWCDLCEDLTEAAGGWTDESTREMIVLVCTGCWEEARELNEYGPPLVRSRRTVLDAAERAGLFDGAESSLRQHLADTSTSWLLQSDSTFRFDPASRRITFERPEGTYAADVQQIGSYSSASSTFQWAWAAYEEGDPLVESVAKLAVFGEVRGLPELTRPRFESSFEHATQLAFTAWYLLGGAGVYAAKFEHLHWFMLLGELRRV